MDGETVHLDECGAPPVAVISIEESVFLSANRAAIGNDTKEGPNVNKTLLVGSIAGIILICCTPPIFRYWNLEHFHT